MHSANVQTITNFERKNTYEVLRNIRLRHMYIVQLY